MYDVSPCCQYLIVIPFNAYNRRVHLMTPRAALDLESAVAVFSEHRLCEQYHLFIVRFESN